MKIINMFQVSGMPDTREEQNAVIDKAFKQSFIHVQDGEGGYWIVRVSEIDENQFEKFLKLDPANPEHQDLMKELLAFYENLTLNVDKE